VVQGFVGKYQSEARMIFPQTALAARPCSGVKNPKPPLPVGLMTMVFYIVSLGFSIYIQKIILTGL
jgi:hypothetical protein